MTFAPEVFLGFFKGEQQSGAVKGDEVSMLGDRGAARACAASNAPAPPAAVRSLADSS